MPIASGQTHEILGDSKSGSSVSTRRSCRQLEKRDYITRSTVLVCFALTYTTSLLHTANPIMQPVRNP